MKRPKRQTPKISYTANLTLTPEDLLGGSRVVISGVISKVTLLITLIRGLVTPHEPPSTAFTT